MTEYDAITSSDDWYTSRSEDHNGALQYRELEKCARHIIKRFNDYKREMDSRVANYEKLEMLADGEVISPKPDLPNVSSGETAGIVRRLARSLVQNTPNVEVICDFDDDSEAGIFARYLVTSKIIGTDQYSNDMQQNLFASTKLAITLGFDSVIPTLLQDAGGSWYIKYDNIHYRDVFPEPGVKDIRDATEVFVRRYMTPGEIKYLIRNQVAGWDIPALKRMVTNPAPSRESQSVSHQDKRRKQIPDGYSLITQYTNSGDPFLTFDEREGTLLRIEKNKHPLKYHPVYFLILEKDSQQPLGRSQVELLLGRQEFQDLLLNGAMKAHYRNINPTIIGFGTTNAKPNLSPGKYLEISNPNARLEPFEVSTQSLLQFGAISRDNMGSMVNLVGSPDQQLATQAGFGMSKTPQGVEQQQQVVDVTTNNYQKAIESFVSHYCSHALNIYVQELKGSTKIKPNSDTRRRLLDAGFQELDVLDKEGVLMKNSSFEKDGTLKLDFSSLSQSEYYVRCVPGSLTEMEDEKQLRILQEMYIPLSQAMPAIVNSGDQEMIANATAAMKFILKKAIELSGSAHSMEISAIFSEGYTPRIQAFEDRAAQLESGIGDFGEETVTLIENAVTLVKKLETKVSSLEAEHKKMIEAGGVNDTSGATIDNFAPPEVVPAA